MSSIGMDYIIPDSFVGTWSYRSLVNSSDLTVTFNDLRFGMGTLVLAKPEPGKIGGKLGGPGWSLDLTGAATTGNPTSVRFEGRGEINGETWVYDYQG